MLQSYNGTAAAAIAEPMTVALTVVLVMLLAFILFCTGLALMFSIRQTFNLEPVLRILLRITFILFLPVLSSVFTLTKGLGRNGVPPHPTLAAPC
jgi:ABC-type Na+ efflux pump permease subunit